MYAVVNAAGETLDTFESWASAARYQNAWQRENMRPATIRPASVVMMEASPRRVDEHGLVRATREHPLADSRPVVALIRLIGWATSAPSRRAERAA